MQQNKQQCPSCGMPLEENTRFFHMCGATTTSSVNAPSGTPSIVPPQLPITPAIPPTPSQQNRGGYSQPTPPTNGYSQPSGFSPNPNQYGQAPPAPMQGGYLPPQQPPLATGYPTPPYPYGSVPPKKKNTTLIVVVSIVGVLCLLGLIFFINSLRNIVKIQTEYEEIKTNILNSQTPSEVTRYSREFYDFNDKYSAYVDADVQKIMSISEEYVDGNKSIDSTYDTAIDDYLLLLISEDDGVSDCAYTLSDAVFNDKDAYLLEKESLSSPDALEEAGMYDSPIEINGDAWIGTDNGSPVFSINAENVSDKTVTYFEIWFFCYDESMKPMESANNLNIEWVYFDGTLIPGETITLEDGSWSLLDFPETAYGLPYISYVEYSDGTSYGSTCENMDNLTFDVEVEMMFIKSIADVLASSNAAA